MLKHDEIEWLNKQNDHCNQSYRDKAIIEWKFTSAYWNAVATYDNTRFLLVEHDKQSSHWILRLIIGQAVSQCSPIDKAINHLFTKETRAIKASPLREEFDEENRFPGRLIDIYLLSEKHWRKWSKKKKLWMERLIIKNLC